MLKELFAIGNYRNLSIDTERPPAEKALMVLKAYGFIVVYLFAIGPLTYLADYCVTHVYHHASIMKAGSDTMQHMIKKIGYATAIIYICLIGPVLEETIFRLPLSFKRAHIAIAIAVAILLFSSPIPFVKNLPHSIGIVYALVIRVAFSVLIFFITMMLIPTGFEAGQRFRKIVIIVSIILFGLMHISNYAPLQWQLIWLYPVYVLAQLGMGVALTYIRLKNGFVWGIALHCLINSVSMSLSSIARQIPSPKAHQHTAVKKATDTQQTTKKPVSR